MFFLDSGGNFIDTAHVYGDWACEEKGLQRESDQGSGWLVRGDKVILSTRAAILH